MDLKAVKKWRFLRIAAVCAVFMIALLAVSCDTPAPKDAVDGKTRQVPDDLDRLINVPEKLERVVSLAPSLTEMIFAVGAGDKLVGVTTYCNYPAEALQIQKVSDTQTPNIESIIALKPQVVFVSTASQLEAFMKILEAQNIAVYVTNPNSFDDVLRNLKQLAELFGTGEKADKLVADLKLRVDKIGQKVSGEKPVRVFVQISKESLYTIGKDSFITEVVERAGGESVTRNVATAYPKLSKETALALNPDAIILSESDDNREPNDVFRNSAAVKNGRVYRINADLISRPGPRLVDAIEHIARDLHPGNQSRER